MRIYRVANINCSLICHRFFLQSIRKKPCSSSADNHNLTWCENQTPYANDWLATPAFAGRNGTPPSETFRSARVNCWAIFRKTIVWLTRLIQNAIFNKRLATAEVIINKIIQRWNTILWKKKCGNSRMQCKRDDEAFVSCFSYFYIFQLLLAFIRARIK